MWKFIQPIAFGTPALSVWSEVLCVDNPPTSALWVLWLWLLLSCKVYNYSYYVQFFDHFTYIYGMTTFFYTQILRFPSTICWKVALNTRNGLFLRFFCHLILLVCGSIYITVLHHFPYCSFVLTSEIRKSNSTETVLFQTCSIILDLVKNMYKL